MLRSEAMPRRDAKLILLTAALLTATLAGCEEDGRWIAWASNREDGRHEIYLMEADARQVTRLTHDSGRRPLFAPDGRWIAYYHDASYKTRVVRPDGSEDHVACNGQIRYWLHDNSGFVCRSGDGFYLIDPDGEDPKPRQLLYSVSDFTRITAPVFGTFAETADGRYILAVTDQYRLGYSGSNGAFKADWAAVALDPKRPQELYYIGAGCQPTSPPGGHLVYHVRRGTPTTPDIYRLDIRDLDKRASYAAEMTHPNDDWGHEYFPSVSNDNAWIVYGASTGCHDFDSCDYELFLHPLGAGSEERVRLTEHAANDRWPSIFVGPAWE